MTDIQAIQTKLSEYDFIVVVDSSGSMGEPVKAGDSRTRWQAMQESVMTFVRDVEAIDADGIDVVQLGADGQKNWAGVTSQNVRDMFASMSPRGGTPLTEALLTAFKLAGKSDKKDFIVVFTDGVPNDETSVKKAILDHAAKQETDDACTILFVQVGDDAAATRFLQGLDDNLKGAKFDIVDAKTVEDVDKYNSTAELVVAAIAD